MHTVHCCRHCFRIFGDRQHLVSHQQQSTHCGDEQSVPHHQSPPPTRPLSQALHQCTHCTASFEHLWRLNKHQKTHQKPYHCPWSGCSKSFADRRNLRIHQRIHRGDRREKCTFCDKSFSDPSTLRNHLQSVHSEGVALKPFICRRCHKAFRNRKGLKEHLLTHSSTDRMNPVAMHRCGECQASFTTRSNLKRHLRSFHDDTASRDLHQCSDCTASFEHLWRLNRHRKIHQKT